MVGNLHKASKSWGGVVADFYPGVGGSKGVGEFFQGGDPGGFVVRGGDVGTGPQDGAVPE